MQALIVYDSVYGNTEIVARHRLLGSDEGENVILDLESLFVHGTILGDEKARAALARKLTLISATAGLTLS